MRFRTELNLLIASKSIKGIDNDTQLFNDKSCILVLESIAIQLRAEGGKLKPPSALLDFCVRRNREATATSR